MNTHTHDDNTQEDNVTVTDARKVERIIRFYEKHGRHATIKNEPVSYKTMIDIKHHKNNLPVETQQTLESLGNWDWRLSKQDLHILTLGDNNTSIDERLDDLETFCYYFKRLPSNSLNSVLYHWVQKVLYDTTKFTSEQRARFANIIEEYSGKPRKTWKENYVELKNYIETHNDITSITDIKDPDLRKWAAYQLKSWGTLIELHKNLLATLSHKVFSEENTTVSAHETRFRKTWWDKANTFKTFVEENHRLPHQKTESSLYQWWGKQKPGYLTDQQQDFLEKIPGFVWRGNLKSGPKKTNIN